jgi:hypothetical protein
MKTITKKSAGVLLLLQVLQLTYQWLLLQEFWNWDMDEVTNYDFPSLVDFIYDKNGGRKFHFVGYSQVGICIQYFSEILDSNLERLIAPNFYMTHERNSSFGPISTDHAPTRLILDYSFKSSSALKRPLVDPKA